MHKHQGAILALALMLLTTMAIAAGCQDETNEVTLPNVALGELPEGTEPIEESDVDSTVIGDTISRLEYCSVYETTLHNMAARCDERAPSSVEIERLVDQCNIQLTRPVLQEILTFDEEDAAKCMKSLTKVCFLDEADKTCESVLQGTLEEGDRCYSDLECSNGFCKFEYDRCPGTCVAWARPGQTCTIRKCIEGYYCNQGLGVCAEILPEGAICAQDDACGEGNSCVGLTETDRKCEVKPPRGAEGEPCGPNQECKEGTFCLTAPGSAPNAVGQCKLRSQVGQACTVGGMDMEWFYRGCAGGLCKAIEGEAEGLCAVTQLGEPCIKAYTGAPEPEEPAAPVPGTEDNGDGTNTDTNAIEDEEAEEDEETVPYLVWSCSTGQSCHPEYNFCQVAPPLPPEPEDFSCERP